MVNASLAEVWDYYFDPAGWPAWVDGFGHLAPERIVAGSVLPEATEYPDLPEQFGGSQEPRLERAPTNGIGISHGLGSKE